MTCACTDCVEGTDMTQNLPADWAIEETLRQTGEHLAYVPRVKANPHMWRVTVALLRIS